MSVKQSHTNGIQSKRIYNQMVL